MIKDELDKHLRKNFLDEKTVRVMAKEAIEFCREGEEDAPVQAIWLNRLDFKRMYAAWEVVELFKLKRFVKGKYENYILY